MKTDGITIAELRRFAVARSLFAPTTLKRALTRLGFVQADPIRAPARAQDLTLRHRVAGYRTGDLERLYDKLGIEEDFFTVYGFVTGAVQKLMHPRPWPAAGRRRAQQLLEFVRERGEVHPREVDRHFQHGTVTNYWGGSSNATTHLLSNMHYGGMLRVARRENGIRIYSACQHAPAPNTAAERNARLDALVDVAAGIYAPVPASGLTGLIRRLRYATPQWRGDLKSVLERARKRLVHVRVDGVDWYWPYGEEAANCAPNTTVRLLTPFDPVVWDRDRFERLWGWAYRFEAYTPVPKRKLGYYALPLLWRDGVIGWANVSVKGKELEAEFGYVGSAPSDRAFQRELGMEMDRMRVFLGL